MRVVKASYAGACYGVQRASTWPSRPAPAARASTRALIHNPQVVAELAARIRAVDTENVERGSVIIRSRRAPAVAARWKNASCPSSTTCPHVARAQKAAADSHAAAAASWW
ncbi:MAG: hypothetical protein ACLR3C_03350 [Eggerthella lenta]